jgi:hypothetical protein
MATITTARAVQQGASGDAANDAALQRREVKLVLPSTELYRMSLWLRVHEAHFAPIYEPRWVNNIYFDTEELAALSEGVEGLCRRMKVRLRWYGRDDDEGPWGIECGTLEFKCKWGPLGWKRSGRVAAAMDLRKQPWCEVLQSIRGCLCPEQRVIFDQSCRPALINRYHREYFLSFDRSVRVTIDTRIRSWAQCMGAWPNLTRHVQDRDVAVIEFKAPLSSSTVLRDAVNALGCRIGKFSKYANGLAGLI